MIVIDQAKESVEQIGSLGRTVRMVRRLTFSAGHRYWRADLSKEENLALFGTIASPYNHGHNYVLDVDVEGQVDESNGMVVNIKVIDDIVRRSVIERYHNKSINDEVPEFAHRAPSLENMLESLWQEIKPLLPSEVSLTQLRLEEMPTLIGEKNMTDTLVKLTRVYEFAASHRLHADALSHEENLRLFGKCNHIHGHGHNYVLEVTVAGTPDPVSGMMCPLDKLDEIVEKTILKRYDHRNLNLDLPEYEGRNTTSEVVALQIFDDLKAAIERENSSGSFGSAHLHRVRVHETARNIFEVTN